MGENWILVYRGIMDDVLELKDLMVGFGVECVIEKSAKESKEIERFRALLSSFDVPIEFARILTPFNFRTDTMIFDLLVPESDVNTALKLISQHFELEFDEFRVDNDINVVKKTPDMIRCPACGAKLSDSDDTCPKCGLFVGENYTE